MNRVFKLFLLAILAFAPAFFARESFAQSAAAGDPVKRAEYERLFKASLANPADLETAFKFAEVANQLNEYEAAIGALERMLFFNPGLSRVRLELGVLYFKLGAYGQARSYFTAAIEAPETPAEVRDRVQGFVNEIDRRDRPSQFSGFIQLGARYQTNANSGPASLNVRALGFDAVLDPRFGKRPDWNAFLLGGFRHVYDFGNQRGDTWETNVQFYLSQQKRMTDFNINLGEITTGPRLSLGIDALPGWSVRPYGILSALGLGNRAYTNTAGGGLSLAAPTQYVTFEFGGEWRHRDFINTTKFPLAGQQSGELMNAYIIANAPITAYLRGQIKTIYSVNHARSSFDSYTQPGVEVSLPYEFVAPFLDGARRWTLIPSATFFYSDYRQPNPLIDANVKRRDKEYRFGLALDAPITELFGFGTQVQYSRNESTISNYRFSNFSVLFGPTARF